MKRDRTLLYVSIFTESGRGPNKVEVIDTATHATARAPGVSRDSIF